MTVIDEVIGTAKRRGKTVIVGGQVHYVDQPGYTKPIDAGPGRTASAKKKKEAPIEEIVVTAVLGPVAQPPRSALGRQLALKTMTRTSPTVGVADLFEPKKTYPIVKYQPVDEIIVTAKKATKLGRAAKLLPILGRVAAPLTVAEILGKTARKIVEEVLLDRFDELGEKATATTPARPDTPVKVTPQFAEQTMTEIVVTGQRTAVRPARQFWTQTREYTALSDLFNRDMLTSAYSSPVFSDLAVVAPTIPQVDAQTQAQTSLATSTLTRTQAQTRTQTQTALRRSTLLGIGTGTAASVATSTSVATATMPITQSQLQIVTRVGQKTKYCKPCPDPRKKKRNKCYRQLVKQGLTPSRDKVSKWAQIDCVTGKTIKELI